MIYSPPGANLFEFVTLASLRAAQLMRGCTPRVAHSLKHTVTAQREVAAGQILGLPRAADSGRPNPSRPLLEVVDRGLAPARIGRA